MYNKKVLIDAVRNLSKTKNSTNTNNGLDNNFKRGGSNKRPSLPKGKSPKSYSRSFEATNRLFAQHPLFKKPKSKKNKIFDPRAQYYTEGGEPCPSGYIRDENGDCVWHDPNQENLSINTSPVHPVEYLKSQLTMGDPFYNTHEVYPSDEDDIRWKPKANIEANLRNTNLKKFIQRDPDEGPGVESGYLHNNIWTSPTLGLEQDTIEPGYAPNQLRYERDGQHPNVYFIKNPVEGSTQAPSGSYTRGWGPYQNKKLSGAEYNKAQNEVGQNLLKQGYKGENMWGAGDEEQLYQLYGTEGLTLKGATKITPETLKYLESIKDSEEGKRYLAKMAGISEDDPDYANMLMHYNTTPIDVYAKSSRPGYEDIPKAKLEQDNNNQTTFLTNTEGPINYKKGGLIQYAPGGYSDEPPGSKKKNYGDSKRILPKWMPKGMVKAIQNTEVGISPYMTNEQAYPIGMKQNLTDFTSGKSLLGEGTKAIGMSNPSYGVNFTTGLTRDISKNKDSGWALKGYLGKPYDPSLGQAAGQAIQKMGKDQYEGAWERYYDDLAMYNAGEMTGSAYREGPDKWDPEKEKPKESVGKFLKGFGKAVEKSPVVGGLSANYRYDKFKQPHGYKAAGEGEIKLDWDPSNNIGLGLKGGLEFYGGDKYHSKNYRPGSYKWNVNPSVTAGIGTRPHFGFNLNAGVEGLPKFMPKNFPGYFYGNVNYNQSLMLPGSFSANAGMKFPLNQYKQKKAQKEINEKIKNDPFIPSNNNVKTTTFGSQNKNGGISINLTEDEIQKYVDGGYIVEDDISVPELNQYAPGGWPPKSKKPAKTNINDYAINDIINNRTTPSLKAQLINKAITPIGYAPVSKFLGVPAHLIFGSHKPETYALKNRYDAWSVYNGLAPEYNSFELNSDGTLAVKNFDIQKSILDIIRDSEKTNMETAEFNNLLDGNSLNFGGVHGNGYISKGIDSSGMGYIDFTDKWDLQPFMNKTYLPKAVREFEVSQLSGGKPFELKNRIYFDNEGNYFNEKGEKLVETKQSVNKNYSSAAKQTLENPESNVEWTKEETFLTTPGEAQEQFPMTEKDWSNAQTRDAMNYLLPIGLGAAGVIGAAINQINSNNKDKKYGGQLDSYAPGGWPPKLTKFFKSLKPTERYYKVPVVPEKVIRPTQSEIFNPQTKQYKMTFADLPEQPVIPKESISVINNTGDTDFSNNTILDILHNQNSVETPPLNTLQSIQQFNLGSTQPSSQLSFDFKSPSTNFEIPKLTGLHLATTGNPKSKLFGIIEPKTGLVNTEQALSILNKEIGGKEIVDLIKKDFGDTVPKKINVNELVEKVQEKIPVLEHTEIPYESNNLLNPNSIYGIHNIYPDYNFGENVHDVDAEIEIAQADLLTNQQLLNDMTNRYTFNGEFDLNNLSPRDLWEFMDHEENINRANRKLDKLYKYKNDSDIVGLQNFGTLTLSNEKKFGKGSSRHRNEPSTLSHIHYFENKNEPGILYSQQLQSDASREGKSIISGDALTMSPTKPLKKVDFDQKLKELESSFDHFKIGLDNLVQWNKMQNKNTFDYNKLNDQDKMQYDSYSTILNDIEKEKNTINKAKNKNLEKAELPNSNYFESDLSTYFPQKRVLLTGKNSMEKRMLQEFLKFAANKGMKKVRIPTPETSTIIQNNNKASHTYKGYPKHYTKLYGEEGMRYVTDQSGHPWLELDVPESYQKGEGVIEAYKSGGAVNYQLGDKVDEATKNYLESLGYTFEKIK
jgi:hypothetical protein